MELLKESIPSDSSAPQTARQNPSNAGFVKASPRAKKNFANTKELSRFIHKRTIKWGRRLIHFSQMPGMLEEVYLKGQEHLPHVDEPSPILAFSHKKFFDVQSITYFMAARPFEKFHNLSILGQAGISSPTLAYFDLVPGILKNPLTDPAAVILAKGLSNLISDLFTSVNTYPVYREPQDIPKDEQDYQKRLGGKRLHGLSFQEYLNHAHKTSRKSLVAVLNDIEKKNHCFIIAPEGGYCFDGSVQPLQDFLAFVALKKNDHPTIASSISYDELCPDRLGRIACYIHTTAPILAPADKSRIPDYLETVRTDLRDNQTIVPSQIIAAVLKKYEPSGRLTEASLAKEYEALSAALLSKPSLTLAPLLFDSKKRRLHLQRFLRGAAKTWFQKRRGELIYNRKAIDKFNPGERSVNSLDWNYNQIKHHLPGIGWD